MKRRFPRKAAMTLLELLVGITVVAVLAAVVIPMVDRAKVEALGVFSSNNLRQLTQANMTYAADHGCFVSMGDQQNLRRWHGSRKSFTTPYDPAAGLLADYLGSDRRVTPCPLLKRMLDKQGPTFEDGSGGYGYNSVYLGGMKDSLFDKPGREGLYVPLRVTRVKRPARTIMFATTAYANGDTVQEYPFCEPPFWDQGFGPSDSRPSPSLHFRFNGRAIVSWCDGHVSFETREDRPGGEVGYNPHGGDATSENLGWFGPDLNNGYWNPENDSP